MASSRYINARFATAAARRAAEKGMRIRSEVELQPSWTLRRVGHAKVHGKPVDEDDNYASSWWLLRGDFQRIYDSDHADPAWAARLMLAIAEIWGGDCALDLNAKTNCSLLAWRGVGRPIGKEGHALYQGDPAAMWIPDPRVDQFYIPGMRELWRTVLHKRVTVPFLPRGYKDVLGRSYRPRKQ